MSHNTEITITSGTDVLSFDTGNRKLAEALNMSVGSAKDYHGGDAVAFLNGSIEWFRNVTDHYRAIVMQLTQSQREWYSDGLNKILSTHDDRPISERYQELNDGSMLSITIFYSD